jgi:hypothetical protein
MGAVAIAFFCIAAAAWAADISPASAGYVNSKQCNGCPREIRNRLLSDKKLSHDPLNPLHFGLNK